MIPDGMKKKKAAAAVTDEENTRIHSAEENLTEKEGPRKEGPLLEAAAGTGDAAAIGTADETQTTAAGTADETRDTAAGTADAAAVGATDKAPDETAGTAERGGKESTRLYRSCFLFSSSWSLRSGQKCIRTGTATAVPSRI